MNSSEVAVVIVTHDGPSDRTRGCIASVVRAGGAGSIVIVDNSESPSGAADVADFGVGVDKVVRVANRGYGAAANHGFGEARRLAPSATAVALLNDDVEVAEGWLAPLLGAIAEGTGVAQPKLLAATCGRDQPPTVNSMGVELDRAGAGSDIGQNELDGPRFERGTDIEIFTGGAALLSVDFIDRTGGFDERYFLYYEDVDLALRGAALGFRYRCEPQSIVWHEGGATTRQLGVARRQLQERNRLWCAFRFASGAGVARACWLSVRRLRHAPRRAHLSALVGGVIGGPVRLWERAAASRAGGASA